MLGKCKVNREVCYCESTVTELVKWACFSA